MTHTTLGRKTRGWAGVRVGLLAGYGPNVPDQYHRAAIYVDRVLKGARPAEPPVDQPTTLDLLSASRTLAMGFGTPG